MIGNDIVDLHYAKHQSNWQRRGFLDKLFTESEQVFIRNANDSEKVVWLFWSMKESAYKIIARQEKCSFYAPKNAHLGTWPQVSIFVFFVKFLTIRWQVLTS